MEIKSSLVSANSIIHLFVYSFWSNLYYSFILTKSVFIAFSPNLNDSLHDNKYNEMYTTNHYHKSTHFAIQITLIFEWFLMVSSKAEDIKVAEVEVAEEEEEEVVVDIKVEDIEDAVVEDIKEEEDEEEV